MKLYFVPKEHEEVMRRLMARMHQGGGARPGQMILVEPHEMKALLASHMIEAPDRDDITESHLN